MKILRSLVALIMVLPLSAFAEIPANTPVNTEVQCDKIKDHADQRKCLESRSEESQKGLESTEKSYRLALSNVYKTDPNKVTMIVKAFDEVSQEFAAYRTKQCDFMAALAANNHLAGDRHLSCEISFNVQRTKILNSEQEKLVSRIQPKAVKKGS